MTEFVIVPPEEGGVTLELSFDDAEILARVLGMTNTGNISRMSPALFDFVQHMTEVVGRNNLTEARKYHAFLGNHMQVHVEELPPNKDERDES